MLFNDTNKKVIRVFCIIMALSLLVQAKTMKYISKGPDEFIAGYVDDAWNNSITVEGLSNGNFVVAYIVNRETINWIIYNENGQVVLPVQSINGSVLRVTSSTTGGFLIYAQGSQPTAFLYNNNGVLINKYFFDAGLTPSVCRNNDGGMALLYSNINPSILKMATFNRDLALQNAAEKVENLKRNIQTSCAGLSNGNYAILWQDKPTQASNLKLYIQIRDPTLKIVENTKLLSRPNSMMVSEFNVFSLSSGGFVLMYNDASLAFQTYNLFLRKFDNSGNPVGDPVLHFEGEFSFHMVAKGVELNNKNILVTWVYFNGPREVRAAIYSPSLSIISPQFILNKNQKDCSFPYISNMLNSTEKAVAVYYCTNNTSLTRYPILAMLFNDFAYNPTCTHLIINAKSNPAGNVSFSGSIFGRGDLSNYKIQFDRLLDEDKGQLIDAITRMPLVRGVVYNLNQIAYRSISRSCSASFRVIDSHGQVSNSSCGLTLARCWDTCATCTPGGTHNAQTHSCTSCIPNFYPITSQPRNCLAANLTLDGHTFTNNVYNKCPDNCNVCSSTETCTVCKPGFYMGFDNLCYSQCPNGTYTVESTKRCEACSLGCRTCSDSNTCTVCFDYFFLNPTDQKCYDFCPAGTILNRSTKRCDSCSANCSTCIAGNTCSRCLENFFLFSNSCVSACPERFFADINGRFCDSCPFNCKNCTNRNTCTICMNNFLLHVDGRCFSQCPDGSFKNGDRCEICFENCEKCSAGNTCNQCKEGLLLLNNSSCVSSCPEKFYRNGTRCDACPANCKACNSNNMCEICDDNFFLFNNRNTRTCVQTCPDMFFGNLQTKTCSPCPLNCRSCLDGNTCQTCNQPFLLSVVDKKCYNTCPGGQYRINNTCQSCISGCAVCPDSNTCTSCLSGLFLHAIDKSCYSECPSGSFRNNSNRTCDLCTTGCSRCNQGNTCQICSSPNYLNPNDNKCYPSCPERFYPNPVTGNTCTICPTSNCKTCPNGQACTECLNGFNQFNSTCVSSCPVGFYAISGKCEPCFSGCGQCNNGSTCSNCLAPLALNPLDRKCYPDCPLSFFKTNNICRACPATCMSCLNFNTCTQCRENTFLNNGRCLATCPIKTFGANGVCSTCPQNCAECSNGQTCTKCENETYFNSSDNMCYTNCPDGFFKNTTSLTCTRCPANCKNCLNESTCDQCMDGKFMSNNGCVDTCPHGFFGANGSCHNCATDCAECNNENSCLRCDGDRYLNPQDNKCQSTCPEEFFSNNLTRRCDSCSSNCKICTDNNTCSSCADSFNLLNNSCLQTCPGGYYAANGICQTCSSGCIECTDGSTCRRCDANLFLHTDGRCYTTCPVSHYGNSNTKTCAHCHSNCDSCRDGSTCSECSQNYYLNPLEQKCNTTCPISTFANANTKRCQECSRNCLDCESENKCNQCNSEFFLHSLGDNSCYSICPEGFWGNPNTKKCEVCDEACRTGFLHNNTWVSQCPNGFYGDSIIRNCLTCNSNCKTCSNSRECTVCNQGSFLHSADKHCYSQCPQGFSANIESKACVTCPLNCSICNNNNECLNCRSNFFLHTVDKQCYSTCPDGFSGDNSNMTCKACSPNCKSCDIQNNSCLQCNVGFYRNEDDDLCYSSCPRAYYPDDINKTCNNCIDNCDICTNDTECTSCSSQYILDPASKECVSSCPGTNQYIDRSTGSCQSCHSSCKTCSGLNEADCLTCTAPLYLAEGKCKIPTCAIDEYKDSSTNTCRKLLEILTFYSLEGPQRFDVDLEPSLKLSVKLTLADPSKVVKIVWKNKYRGTSSNGNKDLTIASSRLRKSSYLFLVDLIYDNKVLMTLTKEVVVNRYKILISITNKSSIRFGAPMVLDASKTYDERYISVRKPDNVVMEYIWTCPGSINTYCSTIRDNYLALNFNDYKSYVQENNVDRITITLTVKQNGKTATRSKTVEYDMNPYTYNIGDFFFPVMKSVGRLGEDVEYTLLILDNALNPKDFEYLWTVNPNFPDSVYGHGRTEQTFRIRFEDINDTATSVFIRISHNRIRLRTLSIPYNKINVPVGTCKVYPESGVSGSTLFTITASDYTSTAKPLKYSLFYRNEMGSFITISETYQLQFTTQLPFTNKLYLQAQDLNGYQSTTPCNVNISSNPNVPLVGYYLGTPEDRLLFKEIQFSNVKQSLLSSLDFYDDCIKTLDNIYARNSDDTIQSNISKLVSVVAMASLNTAVQNDRKAQDMNRIVQRMASKVSQYYNAQTLKNLGTDTNKYNTSPDSVSQSSKVWNALASNVEGNANAGQSLISNTALRSFLK